MTTSKKKVFRPDRFLINTLMDIDRKLEEYTYQI